MAKKRKKRKSGYHHGDLRRALVDAAVGLIYEEGPQALTLRKVARRVGVSHTAPYRHFADKEALLAAVAEEGFKGLHDAMVGASVQIDGDPAVAFQAIGVAYVQFATDHPSHFKVMFGPGIEDPREHAELDAWGRKAFGVLVSHVEACQKVGLVEAGEPVRYALVAWSLVHGLSRLLIDHRIPGAAYESVDELAEFVTGVLRGGMIREP